MTSVLAWSQQTHNSTTMSAPTLQPLDINAPLGTPAAEWAQQTVEAIDPNASTGVVTDVHGNPTTNHAASALSGAPGGGLNADKKHAHLDAIASHAPGGVGATSEPPTTGLVTDAHGNPTGVHSASAYEGAPAPGVNSNKTVQQMDAVAANAPKATAPIPLKTEPAPVERPAGVFTDAHGNPTTNPNASVFPSGPAADSPSVASTPGVQLPGGWIRSPGMSASLSRPHSMLMIRRRLSATVNVRTSNHTLRRRLFCTRHSRPSRILSPPRERHRQPEPQHRTRRRQPPTSERSRPCTRGRRRRGKDHAS